MTCIVGIVSGTDTYIAADTAGVGGWVREDRSDGKLFVRDEYLVGFTSSYRMGQILNYHVAWPRYSEDQGDLFAFVVREVVEKIRAALKSFGLAETVNAGERIQSGGDAFLIATRGRLFSVQCDYQVSEPFAGFTSIGSGSDVAMGSLITSGKLKELRARPVERAKMAVSAAMERNIGVGGRIEWRKAPKWK